MGGKKGPEQPPASRPGAAPKRMLSVTDAIALIVGIVIGAGIFKTPAVVAAHSGTGEVALLLWTAGGVVSLIGALCYAELTSAFPHVGGDYHYIRRAFGDHPAFLFAWARMTVIQTGSIAMIAFLVGDYASELFRLGRHSASLYAAALIVLMTGVNIAGLKQGKLVQNTLTAAIVLGLISMIIAGLFLPAQQIPAGPEQQQDPAVGKAMIFVLLTYGGWNEAAYISAEMRGARRSMVRALVTGIGIITLVYLAVNYVFIRGLGLSAAARSEVVAADFMRRAAGEGGAGFISFLIVLAALSTMNAVIITGARSNYALGRDFRLFSFLGRWREQSDTPVNALLLQAGVSLLLVLLGAGTRSGFTSMVEYTAPVFWLFFLLVGLSVFVLRRKEPRTFRPFRVPLYPVTPLLFCAFCIYMVRSSFAYAGIGALVGAGVLIAGMPLLIAGHKNKRKESEE